MSYSQNEQFEAICSRIARRFASQGIEAQDIIATLPEARQQVFERHYPDLAKQEPICKPEK